MFGGRRITASVLGATLVAIVAVGGNASAAQEDRKIRVVIATGGHPFDQKGFDAMWKAMPQFETREVRQKPKTTSTALAPKVLDKCDVLVMYDMMQPITDEEKASLKAFLARGGGLVALHHCIASHQDWDEYERIIGGLYFLKKAAEKRNVKPSGYQHGVDLPVKIADPKHPVTRGLKDFTIHDEIYWDYNVDPKVHVLLTTDHPKSGKKLAWARREGKGRVVYIQLGHDNHAYSNPNYRRLLGNAIEWTAGRKK